jgi:hypothetical protein
MAAILACSQLNPKSIRNQSIDVTIFRGPRRIINPHQGLKPVDEVARVARRELVEAGFAEQRLGGGFVRRRGQYRQRPPRQKAPSGRNPS